MSLSSPTPILRIFDETKAKEFYVDFLGFQVDWEHRFADDFPLYTQVSRGSCVLHLSEHHGDACPGSAIRIEVADLTSLSRGLNGKKFRYAKPGIEKKPWNANEMSISDPFGNRLIFFEKTGE